MQVELAITKVRGSHVYTFQVAREGDTLDRAEGVLHQVADYALRDDPPTNTLPIAHYAKSAADQMRRMSQLRFLWVRVYESPNLMATEEIAPPEE